MRLWRKRRARPPLMQTGIQVRVNGQVILGPMTLEDLAIIGRFSGYGDLLSTVWWDDHPRTEIILHPPLTG